MRIPTPLLLVLVALSVVSAADTDSTFSDDIAKLKKEQARIEAQLKVLEEADRAERIRKEAEEAGDAAVDDKNDKKSADDILKEAEEAGEAAVDESLESATGSNLEATKKPTTKKPTATKPNARLSSSSSSDDDVGSFENDDILISDLDTSASGSESASESSDTGDGMSVKYISSMASVILAVAAGAAML